MEENKKVQVKDIEYYFKRDRFTCKGSVNVDGKWERFIFEVPEQEVITREILHYINKEYGLSLVSYRPLT